ncbi:MAG: DNA-binding response regulator [Bacteroidetes bacterium]|nr:MAG: DNA-binding response regulator [Bacteroidota bacterium]PIE87746.1 MAG: DNA-binding response regulator [Bacteroidota bacterium]
MKKSIYYIEDEPHLGKIVTETLERERYKVIWETDGAKVLNRLDSWDPDICILDIMLPNVDGYTLCKAIKKKKPTLPVIFLTAKVETKDLLKGFEAGGNDYMRKPFSIEELMVRIEYHTKTHTTTEQETLEDPVKMGKYLLHRGSYELTSPTTTIRLSNRDMEVLEMLIKHKNQVTSRKEILIKIWGDDSYFNSRTLDVYIRKLRKHFKEDTRIEIVTLKGKGYLFRVPG